jgi:hypothetical protein
MLDYVKHRDDVDLTDPFHIRLVSHAGEHVQSRFSARRGCVLGQFDSEYLEVTLGFLEEKSVGATQI